MGKHSQQKIRLIQEANRRLLEQFDDVKQTPFFKLENDALDFTEQVARIKNTSRYKGKPEEEMFLNKTINRLVLQLKNTINEVTSNKKWFK